MADLEQSLIAFPAMQRLQALVAGGMDAVASSVRRALEKEDYSHALRVANERYARRGASDYDAALTYACLLVGRELVDEATGVLGHAIEARGEDPALRALLADALVLADKPEAAAEQLAFVDPDSIERAQVASFMAGVYLDVGDEDAAIALYQRAVDQGIDDPEPAIRLAQLLEGRGEAFGAAVAFDYAARRAKDRVGLWQICADLWADLGEEAHALEASERLLELTGGEADQWLELGYRLAQVGRFDRALSALAQAENLDPFATDALLIRGNVLLELGRPEEAMAAFRKVEKLACERAATQRGLAEAALRIADLSLAQACATRAVELAPDDVEAQFVHGRVLQQFGRHEQALDAFDKALSAEPNDAAYLAARALSQAFLGRTDEARATLEDAVALAKAEPEQRPVLVELDAWQRLGRRLEADQRAWFDEQINFLAVEHERLR